MNDPARHQQLLTSIQTQTDAGFSRREIQQHLLREGFTTDEIKPFLGRLSHLSSYTRHAGQGIASAIAGYCGIRTIRIYNRQNGGYLTTEGWVFAILTSLAILALLFFSVKKRPVRK